jgi:hypothetical protein
VFESSVDAVHGNQNAQANAHNADSFLGNAVGYERSRPGHGPLLPWKARLPDLVQALLYSAERGESSLDFISNDVPNRIENRVSEFVERQDLMVFIGFKTDSGSHAYPARGPGQQTEEGETGAAHFNGTTGGLPSDAESTSLLDFVVALDVSVRCRAFLMRSSNSSFPPVQLENPLPCAAGESNTLRSKQMALMKSMQKGVSFVSIGKRHQ